MRPSQGQTSLFMTKSKSLRQAISSKNQTKFQRNGGFPPSEIPQLDVSHIMNE